LAYSALLAVVDATELIGALMLAQFDLVTSLGRRGRAIDVARWVAAGSGPINHPHPPFLRHMSETAGPRVMVVYRTAPDDEFWKTAYHGDVFCCLAMLSQWFHAIVGGDAIRQRRTVVPPPCTLADALRDAAVTVVEAYGRLPVP
jgi:hypothetical protein